MKKQIQSSVNAILRPFDAKVVRRSIVPKEPTFSMASMIQRLARRGWPIKTVVDIGASNGKWSVECMKYFPNASYLAIEPIKERQEALEAAKNRYANFDYAICVAGEVEGGEVNLNVTQDLDGSTVDGQNPGTARTCPVRTLDSLITQRKLPGPYLLKFDTHGYEVPILSGAKTILANTTAIIMETNNFQLTQTSLRFPEMCSHMERLGFRPVDVADPLLRSYDNAFWQIDILFGRTDSEIFKYQHFR
jgi:FkbM family methyltransferase